jgi:imidazolonepropionase-like amidohydrolase
MLGLIALLVTHTASAATVIHAGFLFDTKRGEVAEQQTITIEGGRIFSVQKGFVDVANADVINLRDAYVSPGFMDMHVHLDGELNPPASYSEEFFMNSADIALRSTVYARRTLKRRIHHGA